MATNGHPATPPPNEQPSKATEPTAAASVPAPAPAPAAAVKPADPEVPLTSASDDGTTKRPRDARLIHLILSSQGIHSYQERVPLQLLDFAYRYTSGILNDSLRLSSEGYTNQAPGGGGRKAAQDEGDKITVTAVRQAIASRQGYTFSGALPKEFMMEQAMQRNQIQLPKVERAYGVQLPPEKYCLTGVGWGLREEWESDEDDEDAMVEDAPAMLRSASSQQRKEDAEMGGMDGDEDEEGAGRMEDVFGEDDTNMAQD